MKTPCSIVFFSLSAALLLVAQQSQTHPVRTWTSSDGKTLQASLVQADREAVTLKLASTGREARVPLERLSEADRAYVADLDRTGSTLKAGAMPAETKIDPNVEVEGGPRSFVTPHFVFECDRGVTKAFISQAARVFEGTREAVAALPLGIVPKPAEGESRFRTLFLENDSFARAVQDLNVGQGSGSSRVIVAGVYDLKDREVLVPFSSLETTSSGSQVSLSRTSDVSVLIHEITHQVMHDWLPMMPVWTAEGLAEYLSAVPYQNGRFEFKNVEAGLKKTLQAQYGISEGASVPIRHPGDFISAKSDAWRGTPDDYRSAMMLTYFFMHLDQPEKPGAALAAYLHLLGRSRQDTEKFIADYNAAVKEYETKRQAFNREIDAYNAAVAKHRAEIEEYNRKVTEYNAQTKAGLPEAERVKVGEAPKAKVMTPPAPLAVPKILQDNPNAGANGPIDILGRIQEQARPALLRDRDPEAIAAAIQEAFGKIGITVRIGAVAR